MNKLAYKRVYSRVRHMLVAVAEFASGRGNGAAKGERVARISSSGLAVKPTIRAMAWAAMLLLGTASTFAVAQIVAAPGSGAQVIQTQNGLPQVNIARPSAAGVSLNNFSQFDVQRQGAILNNSPTIVQTQQAGYVNGNPNLTPGNAARIIVNQVMSNAPSQLRGYTEVAGPRAEVVIANPSGIIVDGAGFINTSRAILTTGTPNFGASGSLAGFNVTGGNITVQGAGLNATNVDQVDLLARAIQVNAAIYANTLNAVTGANQIDHDTLNATSIAGTATGAAQIEVENNSTALSILAPKRNPYATDLVKTFCATGNCTDEQVKQLVQTQNQINDASDKNALVVAGTVGAAAVIAAVPVLASLAPDALALALSNPAAAVNAGIITAETAAAIVTNSVTPGVAIEGAGARAAKSLSGDISATSGGAANSVSGKYLDDALRLAQSEDPLIGTTLSGAKGQVKVTADASIGGQSFYDVNQTARATGGDIAPNSPTLISDQIAPGNPNGTYGQAHAEIGVIQQAYNAGLTQNQSMTIVVRGQVVCSYCSTDLVTMADRAGLNQLTVVNANGTVLRWQKGDTTLSPIGGKQR
jgi:filamentous hemagglutinin